MNIKLLICDVDGTLTDNKSCVDNNGNVTKNFSVLDGMGFGLCKNNNIKVAWVTGSNENCIHHRAVHCGIDCLKMGIKNKEKIIEQQIFSEFDVNWDNIAYIGDDINDLTCIKKAAFSAVPADAIIKYLNVHNYTCSRNGGCGAVREFIEKLLQITLQKTW